VINNFLKIAYLKSMKRFFTVSGLFLLLSGVIYPQRLDKNKHYYISAIGFWNVENLYDTINDVMKNDEEFTPEGANRWTGERYRKKLDRLAEVISQMATDVTPDGLAIMGMCEIENVHVVEDLVRHPLLKSRNYNIVHIEGPDARGVDPSFIYNPKYFRVKKSVSYPVHLETDTSHKTRDILVVSGFFPGEEPMAILVNHWPSRRGGEAASRPNRIKAGKVARHIADSLMKDNPKIKIAIMGDFNDDPVNESIKKSIGTYASIDKAVPSEFFNPMEKLFKEGIGTLAYRDSWNLFDQILLNHPWIPGDYITWQYYSVRVFNKPFLRTDFGNFKGYPFRTFSGGTYTGGYSDHFPVYIIIAKEKK